MLPVNINFGCLTYYCRKLCKELSYSLYIQGKMCCKHEINCRYYHCRKNIPSSSIGFISNVNLMPLQLSPSLLNFSFFNCNRVRCLQHVSDNKHITRVAISRVKNVLSLKKIEFVDGFTCIVIKCPFCVNPKRNEIYINKVTGFVICPGCKRSGEWIEFEELLKRNFKTNTVTELELAKYSNEAGDKWKELCKRTTLFTSLELDGKKLIYKKLNLEVLPDDLFKYLDVRVNNDLTNIYIPLKYSSGSSGEIVGYKTIKTPERNIFSADDNNNNERFLLPENDLTEPCHNCKGILLYRSRNIKKNQTVLVHNFIDFISLAKLNLNYQIICLPHGVTNLPQEILPILEKFEKIVLWFGNSSYWDAAKQFAKKLSEDRCYFVRSENPPPHIVSCGEHSITEAKRIIESAESIRHPCIINFSSIRQDVLLELYNTDKVQGVRWQRFPGLNSLLKGFRRGELSIFTGPTGSGKTTFLSEYSLDLLTQGVPTLWGSFEVRNQRLARTMLQQYVQLPLDLYPEKLNCWADSFERLPLHFMTFHGQQPLKVVLEAVEHASYVYDIAHVIIDNVQFMLGMLDTETNLDRFFRQDSLIAAFRNFATSYNCHVTLVIHPRKERDGEQLTINSVFGGAKASQEADNVFIIQQKMLQSLKIKKYLQVAKNRFTGDLGLIPMDFDKESLCFSQKIDKKLNKKSSIDKSNTEDDSLSKDDSQIEDLHVLQ